MPGEGPGHWPGAACKARQRPGRAGSAAFAWVLLMSLLPVYAADDRTPRPTIEPAAPGTQCVGDPALMRREHMNLLKHQRDDTVRGGIRGARHSLKGCIDCHASVKTNSVARAETNFCVACHSYAAVKIDCFECHASQPRALAQGAPK